MSEQVVAFRPDYSSPPGAYLATILDQLGMTQADLAARTGLSSKHINQVVKGTANVSPETATQLEYATNVPAEVWVALDGRSQAYWARLRTLEKLKSSLGWLDRFDLAELAERGVVPEASASIGTLEALLRYFGIADPNAWERVWQPSMTSFRRSPAFKPDATATTIWLRAGQRLANVINTRPFDEKAVLEAVPQIRHLTQADPADSVRELQRRMAEIGIAVVYVAEFEGCRASGATWWASPSKAVVLLSNRGKREDRFWFSFFHELGHILKHAKRDTFLDQNRDQDDDERPPWSNPVPASGFIDDGSRDTILEVEADEFASEALIPMRFLPDMETLRSGQDVQDLAREIGVSAGVVAGRYQYETNDYSRFNRLRRRVPQSLFIAAV